jgi:O-antigen ligase
LLILVMPLANHPLWTGFVGELTVIKYLGVALVPYALVYTVVRRRSSPGLFRTWGARWFALLVLTAVISFFTKNKAEPLKTSACLSYLSFFALFLITFVLVDSAARLRFVVLTMIGGTAFTSLYVIREWQKYHSIYPDLRPGWFAGDGNYFSVSAVICLPLAFYLIRGSRSPWQRMFCWSCFIVTLVALMLAGSRGAFLALTASLIFALWRSRRRIRIALAVILLVPILIAAPVSPARRLFRPNHSDEESTTRRLELWRAGLQMIKAHPLLGVGLGNFKPVSALYLDRDQQVPGIAHNAFVEIAAEMGVVGLFFFLAMLIATYRSMEKLRRRSASSGSHLLYEIAGGTQVALVAFAVAVLFLSGQYQKLFWLLVFVSIRLSSPNRAASSRPAETKGLRGATAVNQAADPALCSPV